CGGALAPALPAWYPLETDHGADPMRAVIAALTGLHPGEHACIQVLARPATSRQVTTLQRGAVAVRGGRISTHPLDPVGWARSALNLVTPGPRARTPGRTLAADPLRDRDARDAVAKTAGPQWDVAIRYAVAVAATAR